MMNHSFALALGILGSFSPAVFSADNVLAPGFEVTVFAEPFDVDYPAALAAGADGTVYVSSDPDGSLGKERMGKVVACRDEDGDGKADKFWDYIEEVKTPRGGHMVGNRFYLIHPPYLSVYWDEDGDGVAEKSQQLVDGLGASNLAERGGDHTTNGVRMGIDGWLYISVGDFGMTNATGTDGKVVSLWGGGVARVRPDGSELEIYSYHTRNHCDVAISPYLDLFTRDNTNDGKGWNIRLHHLTNLSEHGYPRLYQNFEDEAVKPLLDLGGGSGTGALYLHEPGFPAAYGDMLFTCDWTTGKIYEHSLESNEATFQAQQKDWMDLVRATDIDVDGESRLYTADWRGGRFSFAGDGVPVGKVHRVVPEGATIEAWPDLSSLSNVDLVAQLAHRSAVRRQEAQAEVLNRGEAPELAKELLAVASGEAPLYGKVAAIFTFKQLYGKAANEALLDLMDKEPTREFVLRALADRRSEEVVLPKAVLASALQDENPRVRLQAAIAIERGARLDLAKDLIDSAVESFAKDGALTGQDDFRFPHTAIQALGRIGAVDACLAAVPDARTRGVAIEALKLMPSLEAVAGLEKILTDAGSDFELRIAAMEGLARLVHREAEWNGKFWWSTRPDDRGPYFTPTRWAGSECAVKALEKAFAKLAESDRGAVLEMLVANRLEVTKMNLGEQDAVATAIATSSPDKSQLAILVGGALDPKRKWKQRMSCYRAVSRSEHESALLSRIEILAGWSADKALQEESSREIAEFTNSPALILQLNDLHKIGQKERPEVSRIAWRAILSFSQSPLIKEAFRKNAEKMALANPRAIGYFEALEDLKLAGFEGPIAEAMAGDNTRLIKAAQKAKAAIDAAQSTKKEGVLVGSLEIADATQQAMTGHGEVSLGEKLFTQQACASCHAVSLDEVQKGPYLGSAGSKFTRDYLIESILEPGKTVSQGFQTVMVTMKDGKVYMGFVTREEDGQLDVRDIGGVVTTLQVSEVAKREGQTVSMMPPGLAAGLTVEEFASLIDYLASLSEEH